MCESCHLMEEKEKRKKKRATYTSQSTLVETNSCLLYFCVQEGGKWYYQNYILHIDLIP